MVSRKTFLFVFVWAIFATSFFVGFLLNMRLTEWMGLPPAAIQWSNRASLDYDIEACQSAIWREAREATHAGLEDGFSGCLDSLFAEHTTCIPEGHPDVFHIWASTRVSDWIDPPFSDRTNLVLVSLNAERYGTRFQWWSNGVLYATVDSNLSGIGINETNHWKAVVCYGQFRESGLWWKHSKEDIDPLFDRYGSWSLPRPK